MRQPGLQLRLMVAIVMGIALFGISYWTAYEQCRDNWILRLPQVHSIRMLSRLRALIDEYQAETGTLPASINDLQGIDLYPLHAIDDGPLCDEWNNPIHYEVRREGYELLSFGMDGRPGGGGLDSDLDGTEDTQDDSLRPTFEQFAHELCPTGMWIACVLTGIIGAAICVIPIRSQGRSYSSLKEYLFVLAGAAVGTIVVGQMLVLVHVPSGH